MTLSEFHAALQQLDRIGFVLPDGKAVPAHFHVTEVGHNQKRFIDCGGTYREESKVIFQLWNADDYDHRLHPEKLQNIVSMAMRKLNLNETDEIEVEYQGESNLEIYELTFDGNMFHLGTTTTACLALDACGVAPTSSTTMLHEVASSAQKCSPGGGCC